MEGSSLPAIGRALGHSATAALGCVKKRPQGLSRRRGQGAERIEGATGQPPEVVVTCDEMWTYRGAPHGKQRKEWWISTAVVSEANGSRWVDFEVGNRSEASFLGLYARLPKAGLYRSDAYSVYAGWLPPDRHVAGSGVAVNWNEGPAPVLHRGLHSVWRSKLNRPVRRAKGYTRTSRCWCIPWPWSAGDGKPNSMPTHVRMPPARIYGPRPIELVHRESVAIYVPQAMQNVNSELSTTDTRTTIATCRTANALVRVVTYQRATDRQIRTKRKSGPAQFTGGKFPAVMSQSGPVPDWTCGIAELTDVPVPDASVSERRWAKHRGAIMLTWAVSGTHVVSDHHRKYDE